MPFLINQAILTFIYHKAASIKAKSKIPSESFHIMSCQMKFLMQIATVKASSPMFAPYFISNSTTATQRKAEVQNDTARHILYDKSGRQNINTTAENIPPPSNPLTGRRFTRAIDSETPAKYSARSPKKITEKRAAITPKAGPARCTMTSLI